MKVPESVTKTAQDGRGFAHRRIHLANMADIKSVEAFGPVVAASGLKRICIFVVTRALRPALPPRPFFS